MQKLNCRWLAIWMGLGLCSALPNLQASELAPVPKTSPARTLTGSLAEAEPEAEPPASPAKNAKKAPAKGPSEDPMDKLRQRLAERLGAVSLPDNSDPNVVRVISQPTTTNRAAAVSPEATSADAEAHAERVLAKKRPAGKPNAAKTPVNPDHWAYNGEAGPDNWGQLKPEFSKCSSGTRQSPIDIRDGISVQLDPVQFDYKPSAFRVIDNGHTVQVNVAPGNTIEVMGRSFELVQFDFHRPSEERINGRQFDMVAHLVHKDLEGRLAVVAVLLDRGSVQPVVQAVWNNLPLEKGEELAAKSSLDLNALLPSDRAYFTYMGSLTTPPCSEGVLWMVMKNPVSVSPEQISIFSRLYPMNARPVQSVSGRLIKGSSN
ncbi:MAG TPA: carbonic anhydrase [Rhizobacter sp.]|nr:carbonic anhydrase [Rhizobacter sp.]